MGEARYFREGGANVCAKRARKFFARSLLEGSKRARVNVFDRIFIKADGLRSLGQEGVHELPKRSTGYATDGCGHKRK